MQDLPLFFTGFAIIVGPLVGVGAVLKSWTGSARERVQADHHASAVRLSQRLVARHLPPPRAGSSRPRLPLGASEGVLSTIEALRARLEDPSGDEPPNQYPDAA